MKRNSFNLGRRHFLREMSASALLLPFLRPLEAFSQTDAPPKRILFWFQPCGVVEEEWFTNATTSKLLTAEADFGSSLAALAPWRQKVNVLDNVRLYSSYHEPLKVAPHDAGCSELWTNQACQPSKDGISFTHSGDFDSWSWPLGPSLDQFLADQPGVRGSTPVRSLEVGVQVKGNRTNRRMSYTQDGTPVAPENDPRAVLQRLFGNANNDGQEMEADARKQRRNKRILDRVGGDLTRLSSRLGASDREALDRYMSAVDALEQEVAAVVDSAQCIIPTDEENITDINDNNQIPAIGRLQMKVLAAAFACDITRVGSLMWLGSEPVNRMTWLADEGRNQEYHLCSHGQLPGVSADVQRGWRVATDRWFASQLAWFLQELQTFDPSGNLLDNMLIVCGNEIRNGNSHARDRQPLMTVGGDWYFKTGYYRRGAKEKRHGDLLAEVATAMGVEQGTFGNKDFCGGPSFELRATPSDLA